MGKFVKKKTGLGGGFLPFFPKKFEEKQPEIKLKEEKKLREFIVKTKKDVKKPERFRLLDEEKENQKYSKAFGVELPIPIKENENVEIPPKNVGNHEKTDNLPNNNQEVEENQLENEIMNRSLQDKQKDNNLEENPENLEKREDTEKL